MALPVYRPSNGVLVPILVDATVRAAASSTATPQAGGRRSRLRTAPRSSTKGKRRSCGAGEVTEPRPPPTQPGPEREIIADQLRETPDRTNRVIAKMLGVSHPTVASVRADLEAVGKIYQQDQRVGSDGKKGEPFKKTKKKGPKTPRGSCRNGITARDHRH